MKKIPFVLSFYLVKAFPINTSGGALRDEGVIVDMLDDSEYGIGLAPLGKQDNHFDRIARVAAYSVQNGASSAQVMSDVLGYFLIFGRENQELHRLPVAVDDPIQDIVADNHFNESEYDFFYVVEQEIGRTDNKEVAHQKGTPDGDIFIFVHDRSDNIRSSGTAVRRKDKSQSHTAEATTNNDGHERLSMD